MTHIRSAGIVSAMVLIVVGVTAVWTGCNQHPVEYSRSSGAVEHVKQISGGGGTKLDVLWVIDNSQSMCQEQRQLRDNFKNFITTLRQKPIDFHIAVTTTHKKGIFEKVAKFGEIQSTPHPPVGFATQCRFATDNNGNALKQDVEPVRKQIEAAIKCAKNPGNFQHLKNFTGNEIRCALLGNSPNDMDPNNEWCDKAGKDPSVFTAEDLFPCGDKFHKNDAKACTEGELRQTYRSVPKVIRASDPRYQKGNQLDFQKLKDDFSCMSYVGTRGDSREQGLHAAVEAVSKQKTGGPVGDPYKGGEQAPNHGFIRKNAKLAVVFVTDENDCSHEPMNLQKIKDFGCGEANCYFPTKKGRQSQDPLLGTKSLFDEFMKNLAASKRIEKVNPENVIMASIHGGYKRYSGEIKSCPTGAAQDKVKKSLQVCNTQLGSAKSGDRYEDFMKNFSNIFPEPPSGGGHLKGWMCDGRLQPALEALAQQLQVQGQSCIRERVLPCDGPKQCPDFRYGKGGSSLCQQWGNHPKQKFCASAIQVRLRVTNDAADRAKQANKTPQDLLKQSGICYPDSIGTADFQNGCVVKRGVYKWIPCPGAPKKAIKMQWTGVNNPTRQLADFDVQLRYTELAGGESQSSGSGN